jgi:uncharacterized protein YndB with AHSA1/START domain
MTSKGQESMQPASSASSTTADREIVVTRVFDAPRELVFDAFTDPAHISNWWGPDGFTTTTHEMDVRPGGTWRFVMHGPDGVDYDNIIVYREITSPSVSSTRMATPACQISSRSPRPSRTRRARLA